MQIRIIMLAALLALGQQAWAQEPMDEDASEAPLAEDIDAASNVPMAMETEEPAESVPMAAATGSVARAQFTSEVENREPVDELGTVENDLRTVYFFTELRDMNGQTVTHRWKYNGQVMAEVSFPVGGSRWRVYSSKNLIPQWVGTWTAEVINANGDVVESRSFTYVDAAAAEEAMEPMGASTPMGGASTMEQGEDDEEGGSVSDDE